MGDGDNGNVPESIRILSGGMSKIWDGIAEFQSICKAFNKRTARFISEASLLI
jgi:hypothetical protein